jgi:hypothetical protein
MWADFDGQHLMVSSPVGSRKGKVFRERPQVAVSIASTKNRWHWLSVSGRVVDIQPDDNLEFIDRMWRKYTGSDYQRRTSFGIFKIAIERVTSSGQWGIDRAVAQLDCPVPEILRDGDVTQVGVQLPG